MPDRTTNSQIVMLKGKHAVYREVEAICQLMAIKTDSLGRFQRVFEDIERLFNGAYPGYRACNTPYHNYQHTLDCLLAMARLFHGAHADGRLFDDETVVLGLVSALLHDTGYIQTASEIEGTGARFTRIHVQRSVTFAKSYLQTRDFSKSDSKFCQQCILFTALDMDARQINVAGALETMAGKMLATGDLVSQMADEKYLERLSLLAAEFEEAGLPGYTSEAELMRQTLAFHMESRQRFETELDNVIRFFQTHFRERWGKDADLYSYYIDKQMRYLANILEHRKGKYYHYLNRKNK